MRSTALLLVIATTSLCASCAASPVLVMTPNAGCSSLVPRSWLDGVASTPLPAAADLAARDGEDPLTAEQRRSNAWRGSTIGQTGQLDKANGRTADAMSITQDCEKRDAAAAKAIARPWWKVWG